MYADDFQSERSDRERMQSEKDALKETLDAVQQQVLVLEEQVSTAVHQPAANTPSQLFLGCPDWHLRVAFVCRGEGAVFAGLCLHLLQATFN